MTNSGERMEVVNYVKQELRHRKRATTRWSFIHHAILYCTTVLSAAAGLVLQLKFISWDGTVRTDIATILTAISSIAGAISVSGGFANRWRASRFAKTTLEQIEIELMDPSADLSKVREELWEMKRNHNISVSGGDKLARDKTT
ncbi:hypothetical protein ACQVRY_13875 [Ralstonia pseudosolanacearum]